MTLLENNHTNSPAMPGNLPVTSRYTFGLAGERFFRTIMEEGRLLGTYCPDCDHLYVPPTIFCERCLSELDDWVDVGISGEVGTFTVMVEDVDGAHLEQPKVVAFVHFGDGGLVHFLQGVEPEQVKIGMKVQAEFKPQSERSGSILDITHFAPVPADSLE